MKNYRKLNVWNKAHKLALDVYQTTGAFPADERFGLTSQMRRAAVSIPSNIAEGYGRSSERDFGRFLYIASGSVCELECQFLLARDLGYIDPGDSSRGLLACEEVRKMLAGLLKKLAAGG